jgi:DNA-binding NarL/FixJ family response regulator
MPDFDTVPELTLSSNPLIRVLIVEDHQMFAEALARALRDEPDMRVDGISQRLDDAREFLRRKHVDVVLMDYHLPDGDGIMAARYIRDEHPRTRVIVVSAVEDRQVLDDALVAGCSGFISKSESLDHLPSAIRGAMVGNIAISPAMVPRPGVGQRVHRTAALHEPRDPAQQALPDQLQAGDPLQAGGGDQGAATGTGPGRA